MGRIVVGPYYTNDLVFGLITITASTMSNNEMTSLICGHLYDVMIL